MDTDRFDSLTRSIAVPSRRAVFSTLAATIAARFVTVDDEAALAKPHRESHRSHQNEAATLRARGKGNGNGKKKDKSEQKITICHEGQTIDVARSAWKKHKKHGHSQGACVGPPTSSSDSTTVSPVPPFCSTNPTGSACQGTGSTALRCCAGTCPAPPTCLPGDALCADGPTCDAQCCSHANTFNVGDSGDFFTCSRNTPGSDPDICSTDADCDSRIDESPAWCFCSKCCLAPGTVIDETGYACDACCNGCAPGNATCA